MINITKLVAGDLVRMSSIERYSTHPHTHRESVAEHSFYVAFFSKIIGEDLLHHGIAVDMKELLSRAVLHDLDESFSGDVVRPFKYSSDKLREELEIASEKCFKNYIESIIGDKPVQALFYKQWKNAKDKHGIEGYIIAFADLLSVFSYSIREIRFGNEYGYNVLNDVSKYLVNLVNEMPDEFRHNFITYMKFLSKFSEAIDGPTIKIDMKNDVYYCEILKYSIKGVPTEGAKAK